MGRMDLSKLSERLFLIIANFGIIIINSQKNIQRIQTFPRLQNFDKLSIPVFWGVFFCTDKRHQICFMNL